VRIGGAAGVTDTGRRRLRNEDAFVCRPPLFAVADGMGGARAGEIAAEIAATALEESGFESRGAEAVVDLIVEANRRIWERSVADPSTSGMGAVVTAALVDSDGAVAIGHVGDSRAYLLRNGAIEQLTTDHSLVAELVESGVLTPEEAETHPQRSAITRALGTDPLVEVDAFTVAGQPGDVFLICSDGLPTMVSDERVAELVAESGDDLARAADRLVAAANAGGGVDNVTVVLFELLEGEEVEPPEPVAPTAERDGALDQDTAETVVEPPVEAKRHGAGKGGRIAALALIAAVLGIAVVALYWGVGR
jgi:serine/threonine protein phosphatase PrpC